MLGLKLNHVSKRGHMSQTLPTVPLPPVYINNNALYATGVNLRQWHLLALTEKRSHEAHYEWINEGGCAKAGTTDIGLN